jgi:hypothetical protein
MRSISSTSSGASGRLIQKRLDIAEDPLTHDTSFIDLG